MQHVSLLCVFSATVECKEPKRVDNVKFSSEVISLVIVLWKMHVVLLIMKLCVHFCRTQ